MQPTEMNALITALTNHLYCTLSDRDFIKVSIFLSMLSKDMFSMAALNDLCKRDDRDAGLIAAASGSSGAEVAAAASVDD